MCKRAGLNLLEIDDMTIGFCLDYIQEYAEQNKPEEKRVRKATQEDFDAF